MNTRQIGDGEGPLAAIIETVAAVSGKSVTELPPLANTVDPDAVNTVLEAEGGPRVSFDYHGYRVTVDSDEVSITVLNRHSRG